MSPGMRVEIVVIDNGFIVQSPRPALQNPQGQFVPQQPAAIYCKDKTELSNHLNELLQEI